MTENQAPPASRYPHPAATPGMRPRSRGWIAWIALAFLLAAGAWSLRKADDTKPKDWLDSQLTYVPSGKMLKPMVLDFDHVVADLLWIRGMIYFADAYLTGKSYKWMSHIIDVVTTLNPRLHQAYEFAGVVLTKEKHELPKTLRILDRGIGEFQQDWKLRLYAAIAQLAHDSNYTKAAELLQPVATQEDVPGHIKTMCASLLHKGGNRRVALAFLVDRYLETKNPISRELFVDKMLKLYPAESMPRDSARIRMGLPPGDPSVPLDSAFLAALDEKRKKVIRQVIREAEVEPMAEFMALEVLSDYLKGTDMRPSTLHLLKLLPQ